MSFSNFFIIADVGLSSGKWYIIEKNQATQIITKGFHPFISNLAKGYENLGTLKKTLHQKTNYPIFYFGTGCSKQEGKNIIITLLKEQLHSENIYVETDIFGASLGLHKNEKKLIGILGTGSNSTIFHNHKIISSNLNSGFLFGNEGSGFDIGRNFIKKYLDNDLDSKSENMIEQKTLMSKNNLVSYIYSLQQPYTYIASFTKLLDLNNATHYQMIKESLEKFIQKRIQPLYQEVSNPVYFYGSIAYAYQDILIPLLRKNNIEYKQIEKDFLSYLIQNKKMEMLTENLKAIFNLQ